MNHPIRFPRPGKLAFFGGLLLFLFFGQAPAQGSGPAAPAGGGFGSGINICTPPVQPVALVNPTTITDCTQAGIQNALDFGGHINFSCGPGPVTIPISSQLEINPSTDTVLDGGGLITLDGQGITRILHKAWHPNGEPRTITLQNLRLINGGAPSGGSTGDHSGGAIASGHPGTRLHIINSTFENNSTRDIHTTDNQGGAIFSSNSYETVISGSVFVNNSAGNGGAMGGIATGLLVFNSRFSGNTAQDDTSGGIVRGYGGAIHLDGVTNSYNPASNKTVQICGSVFENNTSVRGGGAIGVVVSDNKGIKATYEKSTFQNNEVTGLNGQYGQGGGIYHIEDDHAGGVNEDNLEIVETTFEGNLAGRQGGGAWIYILGRGKITNSTFESNSTTAPFNQVGQGGGLVITLGTIDITNVTFANNHAAYQGGALHGGGSGNQITLKNTIFLNNTLNYGQTQPSETKWQGYHTNRPMLDGGQNIQEPRFKPIYNNDVNNNITANPIYADPLLLPIADNGGYNRTMALQTGSPAIDAGASGCPLTDQRGELRDGPCDIGATEYISDRLVLSPVSQAVQPGETARYTIHVHTNDGGSDEYSLTVTNPYPDLIHTLTPSAITPGQTASLTITDTRGSQTLMPGIWHTLTITATGPSLSLPGEVRLLVGGARNYLPQVQKN